MWLTQPGTDAAKGPTTAQVQRGSIEDTVSALGNLQPRDFVDVGTQVTGQLKLKVAVGDKVKKGNLVAEIDAALFKWKLEGTRATLVSLRAQRAERQAALRLAEQQFARNQELFGSDAVSEELLQQSAATAEQTAAQVAALSAQIEQAQSQIRGDEANLRYTSIYAPIDGTVVSITARQGQTLVASQQAPIILRVADLGTMTAWVQVSEAEIPKIELGMPVYFNTLGQPRRRWHGTVRQVMPTPETLNNVVLYNVLFDVANPDQALMPQMSAQAFFVLAKADDALLVPTSALTAMDTSKHDKKVAKEVKGEAQANERQFTVRVLKDGLAEEREVSVGVMTRATAQVLAGLTEGETVYLNTPSDSKKDKQKGRELPRLGEAMSETVLRMTPLIDLRGFTKTYDSGGIASTVLHGISLDHPRRRVRRAHGAVRLGQDNPHELIGCLDRPSPEPTCLQAANIAGSTPTSWPNCAAAQLRLHLPALQPDRHRDSSGERGDPGHLCRGRAAPSDSSSAGAC